MTNDKDSAVLEPCPFCGSANIDPEGWGSENSSGPACDDCGASAGSTVASTPEENIEAWNKRQPTQSDALREAVIEECAKALEADAKKCDCFALEERECGCGAWCEWKSITSAKAVEIVRELKDTK